ncbi:MAG: DUF2284 domain-containing protein [Muribaculaceae bacterium]|nr:DUF2284 domain-containing protein [Muribaculaceae bacterium]
MEILRTQATLPMSQFLRDYRDAERVWGCCAACDNYGRLWSCPPLERDVDGWLVAYGSVCLFASQVFLTGCHARDAGEAERVVQRALDAAWEIELPRLYALEAATAGSCVFTGRCRLCRPGACTRAEGKPCRHPDRLRYSLEALGFDLEKASRELLGITLQWATGSQLPRYLTLLTAIATP